MSGKPINPSGYKFPPNTSQQHNGGYYGKGPISSNPVRKIITPPASLPINNTFRQTLTRISGSSGSGGCSSCGH